MGTYYVNLDVSYTTAGIGTVDTDPFNFSQFVSQMAASGTDDFYIKGQREAATTDLNCSHSKNLYVWPGNSVFRLKMQDFNMASAVLHQEIRIQNAILSFSNMSMIPGASGGALLLVSTFIKCASHFSTGTYFGAVCILFGSTLVANSISGVDNYTRLWGQDSIIDIPTANISQKIWTVGHAPAQIKSAFTFGQSACLDPTGDFIDCQFNWLPPTWPSWDAPKSAFNYLKLSKGFGGVNPISAPPQPGDYANNYISQSTWWTQSYAGTDYSKGLWGTRNGTDSKGIGAMDFNPDLSVSKFSASSVTDGSSVTSSVNLDSLVTYIQADGTDTYFDSTAKIARVDAFYVHQDGRQNTRVIHWGSEGFQANVSWTPGDTRDGTWSKVAVKAFDHENAEVTYDNTSVLSAEALTHASGVMNLNTN